MRGANGGKTDNRKIVAEILDLRAERARLLGFEMVADSWRCWNSPWPRTPDNVRKLLMEVWGPARSRRARSAISWRKRRRPRVAISSLAAWDWRYYAEKVRKAKFDVDDGEDQALPATRQRHRRGLDERPASSEPGNNETSFAPSTIP